MTRKKKEIMKEVIVDLWGTDLHSAEIGIRKHELFQSKDRQFTKDMDIFGSISDENGKIGYVALREEEFAKDVPEGKLVIKSFTDKIQWTGSIEEMFAKEFATSMITERVNPVFTVNIEGYKPLVELQSAVPREIFPGKTYSFYLFDSDDKILHLYRIREDRLTFGDDWNVNDISGEKVARINGKVLNIGGKFKIDIYDRQLGDNEVFIRVLILFASMLKYRKKLRKKIKKTMKLYKEGKIDIKLSFEEIKLYQNPRRLTY